MRKLIPALALLATASCVQDGGGGMEWREEQIAAERREFRADDRTSTEQVGDAIRAMHGAYGSGDLEKVGTMLVRGVTCYNAHTGSLHKGRDSVLRMFGAMLAHRKEGKPKMSKMERMEIRVDGPTALATYRFVEEEGGQESISIVTHTLRRVDGAWLTTHLHWSGVAKRD